MLLVWSSLGVLQPLALQPFRAFTWSASIRRPGVLLSRALQGATDHYRQAQGLLKEDHAYGLSLLQRRGLQMLTGHKAPEDSLLQGRTIEIVAWTAWRWDHRGWDACGGVGIAVASGLQYIGIQWLWDLSALLYRIDHDGMRHRALNPNATDTETKDTSANMCDTVLLVHMMG